MSSDHKARAALLIRPGERNLAMFRIAIVLAIAAAVTPWAAAGVRAEACDNGICADGRDDGRTLNVYLRTTMTGMSHYNIRVPGRSQFESTGRFQIPVQSGRTYNYSVQVCRRGGVLQSSICTQWVDFHHDVRGR